MKLVTGITVTIMKLRGRGEEEMKKNKTKVKEKKRKEEEIRRVKTRKATPQCLLMALDFRSASER